MRCPVRTVRLGGRVKPGHDGVRDRIRACPSHRLSSQRKLGPNSPRAPWQVGSRVKPGMTAGGGGSFAPHPSTHRYFHPYFRPSPHPDFPAFPRLSASPRIPHCPDLCPPLPTGCNLPRCRHLPQLTRRGGDDRDGGGRRTLQVRLAARHPTGCPTAQTRNPIAESAGCLITPYSSEAPRALRPRYLFRRGKPYPGTARSPVSSARP